MGSVWRKKNKPGLPSEIKYFLNDSAKGNTIIWEWILERHFKSQFLAWVSTLFCFCKMLFTNRLEFSCFADFFVCTVLLKPQKSMVFFITNRLEFSCFADFFVCTVLLKPQKSMVFFKKPPVPKLWIAWSKRLKSFVKLMSQNSISDFVTGFVQNYKRKYADKKV